MKNTRSSAWWGAPRKFTMQLAERKISWLELFYDLVYVVAIARITQYFSEHQSLPGFLDYVYLFIMVFWGWFNGSMYHDLHGTPGIRTRLMTLWQMTAVSALVICLSSAPDKVLFRSTIALMVLQFYITYLWWSVGIYDKEHRRLNKPYTVFYLLSLAALFSTLYLPPPYTRIGFFVSLFFNFLPPFYVAFGLRDRPFRLSASMTERLGLFTIIMFGETVAGLINGATQVQEMSWHSWGNFILALLVVFAMWWIFFALIADRECKEGFLKGQVMIMVYIPVLMSLGMLSTSFHDIFHHADDIAGKTTVMHTVFTGRIALFLTGTIAISNFLVYSGDYLAVKKRMQWLMATIALLIGVSPMLLPTLSTGLLFLVIFMLLSVIIVIMTVIWLRNEANPGNND